ncbi:hypothetical protein JYU34_003732 [Plutella xylostella]|uniref:Reverse transcriptase domain-containing protein n=1 Tax=Plutella xylostella TaxID=51655 RepID=A0ABQ7R0T7_PLUXY|nr:hypothetical protein JYU34_003732 [Plutella xylostella]
MHKKFQKNIEDEMLKIVYHRYRNFCNGLLKKLKRQHQKTELEKACSTNMKQTWKVINNITQFKKQKIIAQDLISTVDSPNEAVNNINTFFADVGRKLANKILEDNLHNPYKPNIFDTPTNPMVNSFVMLDTDVREVMGLINNLKCNSSSGWDNISGLIVKQNKELLSGLIVHICNLSLRSGRFPDAFKHSTIIPIHKSGDKADVGNYRPISILPTLSKILERIINNRLINYLESENLLSCNQYGFRKGRSTADAVSDLTDHIVRGLDAGEKCLAIFLDLAKAFDTVSIPRLLCKLERLGIRDLQLQLFNDYLSKRTQSTKIGNFTSEPLPVTYGVPQGSILGPTLFLIYINDLCNLELPNGKIFTFADDTALVFSGKSWEEVYFRAQSGFDKVSTCLRQNLLSLNPDKTKYLPFTILKSSQPANRLNYLITAHQSDCHRFPLVACNCPKIENVPTVKYLGVVLDRHFKFLPHIQQLSNRIRKLIVVFKNIRHVADTKLIRMVYFALCQSLLTYCIDTWGGAAKTHLIILERAQRAILKVSHFLPYRHPTTLLYKKTNLLTVRQLFVRQVCLIQHKTNPSSLGRRRADRVYNIVKFKNFFTHRFTCYLGSFLYNKLSKIAMIKNLNKISC